MRSFHILLNYRHEVQKPDEASADLEKHSPRRSVRDFVDPLVSWFRILVSCVVCPCSVVLGDRSGERIFGTVVYGGLAIRFCFLFGNMLVADLCTDHICRFPWPLAYFLLFCVTAIVGIFPGIFAGILSYRLQRIGPIEIGNAPLIWIFTEFLRYWITGNNWNSIGYSLAFNGSDLLYGSVWRSIFGWHVSASFQYRFYRTALYS